MVTVAPPQPSKQGRAAMQALVAVLAAVSFIGGFYVLGRAMKSQPASVSVGGANSSASNVAAQTASDPNAAGHVHTAAVDDRGFSLLENGVQHSHAWEQPTDPAARALLAHQLTLARETALRYPTIKDAEAAGLRRAGPFSPGLGTHYINFTSAVTGTAGADPITDAQIGSPLAWIYDGTKPDSPIAGLFYMAGVQDPPGFAGTNDVWHHHTNICITRSADGGVDAPLGADHDATQAQCSAVGGHLIPSTGPLLHVWVVPGYEDPQGVFAHLNPAITCNDGTYFTVDVTQIGTRKSACRDGTE